MSAVSDGHDAHHRALQGLLPDQRWMDGRKLKTCAKCHQNFTLDYFHSSRRARTGWGTNVYRHAFCASCRGVPPFPLIHTVDTESVLHRLNREDEEKEKEASILPSQSHEHHSKHSNVMRSNSPHNVQIHHEVST